MKFGVHLIAFLTFPPSVLTGGTNICSKLSPLSSPHSWFNPQPSPRQIMVILSAVSLVQNLGGVLDFSVRPQIQFINKST